MELLIALMVIALLMILVPLLRPYRSPYVSRTTKTRNGLPYWKDKELY
jgi:hypothetical protein